MHGHDRQGLLQLSLEDLQCTAVEPGAAPVLPGAAPVKSGAAPVESGAAPVEPVNAPVLRASEATGP